MPLLCAFLALPHLLSAAPPPWWAQRGVTNANPSDDKAVANRGQLKQFALKARDELDDSLPGGAGGTIDNLILSWRQPGVVRDDLVAVSLGQLRFVGKLFHDRLIEEGYTNRYPWTPTRADDDDSAVALLGQLKKVFAFNPVAFNPNIDGDGDGMLNGYEVFNFLDPLINDGLLHLDGDGVPNREDARPNDQMRGRLAVTIITPGNGNVLP